MLQFYLQLLDTAAEKEKFEKLYEQYRKLMMAEANAILKSKHLAEDAVQETFCSYLRAKPVFESGEHEKAWLIRVATNTSRDLRRSLFWRRRADLEEAEKVAQTPEERDLLEGLLRLPDKYKIVLHLHYIEGYKIKEIAQMTKMSENNVKVHLFRGRKLLKLELEEEKEGAR